MLGLPAVACARVRKLLAGADVVCGGGEGGNHDFMSATNLPYAEVVSRPRTRASAFRTQRAVAPSCHPPCSTVARPAASCHARQRPQSEPPLPSGLPRRSPRRRSAGARAAAVNGTGRATYVPTHLRSGRSVQCRHLARERRGRQRRLGFGAGLRRLLYRRRRWLQVLPNSLQGMGGQKIGEGEESDQAHFSIPGRLAGRRARLV